MGDVYKAENFALSKSVFRVISRIKREAMAALDQAFASDPEISALEVSAAQFVIIATLAEQEANSSAQLCKSFSYDPGAMTRMVDRLEAKGLLERRRSTDDRRLINLELTDAGKAIFPKLKLLAMQVQNSFLQGFNKDEVRVLEGFL